MPDQEDLTMNRMRLFGELLADVHSDLFAFIYSLVQHHADAEDVYQQVTLVLWEKFDSFELGTNFASWATTVAHNTARGFIRSRKRNAITFGDEVLDAIAAAHTAKQCWGATDTSEALSRCLKKLTDRDRRLVERCYSPDSNFTRIARDENRTVGAIYQAICRIRKNLYTCVKRTMTKEGTS
ncbi:sigma-70 family RNA polymerase sigma factor [Aeoliella sp. SH292]|jgi:RNA polymerase sigma-70 factor (ECF subfamily)|uniref:sigma-70 family RNA polymerase sigma factor n=1 Tax=Aeoliella sp. SH292 TaxID=3454464 RepID=UPI003F9AC621